MKTSADVSVGAISGKRSLESERNLDRMRQRFAKAIRPADSSDLPDLARIHVASGTPGLLTNLGPAYLQHVFYRRLIESPLGRAEVIQFGGRIAGFITWSADSAKLYRSIVPLLPTLRFLVAAVFRRPRILLDFVETAFHAEQLATDVSAELVTLEIDPSLQRLGLGYVLLDRAVEDLRSAGAQSIKARILDPHRAVERLYEQLGFRRETQFRQHGRAWVLLVWRAGR